MWVSEHFKREEFACHCNCGQDTVDVELILILEDLREHFGVPVVINSGNRCVLHNAEIGGAKKSQHVRSKAADIVVKGVESREVYSYLNEIYPDRYGMGLYVDFVHIDCRSERRRW